jgi:phosphatidylserine decarboxylase
MKPIYRLLTELSSRKSVSMLTGKLAKSKLSKGFISHFAKTYNINLSEAEKELREYPTLNAFFTRRLKEGLRPIDAKVDTVVSPVDALITGIGEIKEGTILNVKGQTYTVDEMLEDTEHAASYRNGHYVVLYLSPTDYHRIHTPISGEIVKHVHKLGKVYPVNDFGLKHARRVLSRNERLITYIKNKGTEVAVVKVGALNVASIQISDRLKTADVKKGDELAYFEFGSTVVLLFKEGTFQFLSGLKEGDRVKLGESIGVLVHRIDAE